MKNNNPRIFSKLLYRLYAVKKHRLRDIILQAVATLEGGQMLSSTLRRIFSDYHQIEIGLYSYGGCFDLHRIRPFTKIGRFCAFAPNVCIFNANHPLQFKSTHPYFYEPAFGYVQNEKIPRRCIEIGNDVWVGQSAIILPSVKRIGDGAVIGAGAVVTKDVPDFAIVAGNPAVIIRYRFDEETIRKLKEECWWNKDIEELKANLNDFCHPLSKDTCHYWYDGWENKHSFHGLR